MKKSQKTPDQRRRFPVGYDPRKERRQLAAKMNREAYDALTLDEKIELVKSRPGASLRELQRLARQKEKS